MLHVGDRDDAHQGKQAAQARHHGWNPPGHPDRLLLARELQQHANQERQFEQQAGETPLDAMLEPGGEYLQPGDIDGGLFHGSASRISNPGRRHDCRRSGMDKKQTPLEGEKAALPPASEFLIREIAGRS